MLSCKNLRFELCTQNILCILEILLTNRFSHELSYPSIFKREFPLLDTQSIVL